MKQLTRKLFLSICTLAICAVTLVSTTFAWYTSNTEVNASSIITETSADNDSSLLVKQLLDRDAEVWSETWTNYLEFTVKADAALIPVQYDNSTFTYTTLSNNPAVIDKNYLEFTFKFTSNSTVDTKDLVVYFNSFTATATGATAYENLLFGNPKNVGTGLTGKKYTVDALYATNFVIEDDDNTVSRVFGLENFAKVADGIGVGTASALTYYNIIMGEELEYSSNPAKNITALPSDVKSDDMPIVTTISYDAANNKYEEAEVTIGFYIDGWDAYCYDGCKGQDLTFTFSFSLEKPKNN